MRDDIKKAELHAIQYRHVDGSFELTFGGTLLLMAISFYAVSRIPSPNLFVANNILPWIPLAVMLAGGFLLDAVVKHFRMRVTVLRSGYIKDRKPEPFKLSTRLAIWIGIPVLTVILLVLLFLNRTKFYTGQQVFVSSLMPSFFGVLFGGLWIIVGWKLRLPRFYLLAVISLAVSVVLFFGGRGGNVGEAVLFGVMGTALCASGGITLWHYLRTTKPPEDSSPAI